MCKGAISCLTQVARIEALSITIITLLKGITIRRARVGGVACPRGGWGAMARE